MHPSVCLRRAGLASPRQRSKMGLGCMGGLPYQARSVLVAGSRPERTWLRGPTQHRQQSQTSAGAVPAASAATVTQDALPSPRAAAEPTPPQRPDPPDQNDSGSTRNSGSAFGISGDQLAAMVEAGIRSGRIDAQATELAAMLRTRLATGLDGADTADLAARTKTFGANRMPQPDTVSFMELMLDAFKDPTMLLLSLSGILLLGLHAYAPTSTTASGAGGSDWIEGAAILVAVVIVVGVSSVTNYQKEGKFRELNKLKDDIQVRVIRGGQPHSISVFDLQVGDVALVETGDLVPADGILHDGGPLKVDESHMTGESEDVVKCPAASNLLLSGSKVLQGFGHLLVLAVGVRSQQGRISSLILGKGDQLSLDGDIQQQPQQLQQQQGQQGQQGQKGQQAAPLQGQRSASLSLSQPRDAVPSEVGEQGQDEQRRRLAAAAARAAQVESSRMGKGSFLEKKLGVLAQQIGSVGMVAAAGSLLANVVGYTWQGLEAGANVLDLEHLQRYLDFFVTSITVLIVAIPEGLPLAVTLALAFSVQRMLADNNLVRHLGACETMACATTVCTDKTGTLTQNQMAVVRMQIGHRVFHVRRSSSQPRNQGGSDGGNGAEAMHSGSSSSSSSGSGSGGSGSCGRGGEVDGGGACTHVAATLVSFDDISPGPGGGQELIPSGAAGWRLALPRQLESLLISSILLNSTASTQYTSQGVRQRSGSRTECALLEFAQALAAEARQESDGKVQEAVEQLQRPQAEVLQVMPFTSERKCMSTLIRLPPSDDVHTTPSTPSSPHATAASATHHHHHHHHHASEDGSHHPHRSHRSHQADGGSQAVPGDALGDANTDADAAHLHAAFVSNGSTATVSNTSNTGNTGNTSNNNGSNSSSPQVVQGGSPDASRLTARLLVKGAAEVVLRMCDRQLDPWSGAVTPLREEQRAALESGAGERQGLRMMALAYRDVHAEQEASLAASSDPTPLERSLTLIALVGLQDPLRPEAAPAVAQCQRAGLVVRMLTGDNARTAASIAAQAGILPRDTDVDAVVGAGAALAERVERWKRGERAGRGEGGAEGAGGGGGTLGEFLARSGHLPETLVIEGQQLRQLTVGADGQTDVQAFRIVWPRMRVLARCTPQDKYLLVTCLRQLRSQAERLQQLQQSQRGANSGSSPSRVNGGGGGEGEGEVVEVEVLEPLQEVVAMTGDGTNDAPALSAADVGFAMNSGTSVAKDAADILILNDSFSSIVSAVKWGRNVFASITKFLQFQLTANLVAVTTACLGAVVLQESPLSAVQMLWVNLIMDSLASLALATEAPTDAMLDLPPNRPDQPLLTPTVTKHVVGQAAFQLTVLLGLLFGGQQALGIEPATNNTMVFNAFVMIQLFNQFNCRKVHDEPNILEGALQHPLFISIVAGEALLQYLIIQHGGSTFQTVPLNASQWLACVGFGATALLVRRGLTAWKLPEEAAVKGF